MKEKLIELLKKDKSCMTLKGVTVDIVNEAEEKLQLKFSDEYRNLLQQFGIVSIYGHEIVGLGSSKRLDVVYNTLTEREINEDFPLDQYVVEEAEMDGIVITQNSKGSVYQVQPHRPSKKIADSLAEYLYKE